MLIRFNVENFRSFQKEATLSMIPGESKQHTHHIYEGDENAGFKSLRIALLYGKNASGKSNLVQAMKFAQNLIVNGTEPYESIDRQPYRLDNKTRKSPSKFEFEFATNGVGYAYGFSVTNKRVVEEWLYQITMEKDTKLFERTTSEDNVTTINFGDIQYQEEGDINRLRYEAEGTRYNQLFLRSSIDRNINYFSDVFNWFRDSFSLIFPNSISTELGVKIYADDIFKSDLENFMRAMDTGISEVCYYKVDSTSVFLPSELVDKIEIELTEPRMSKDREHIKSKKSRFLHVSNKRYMVSLNENDRIQILSLGTKRIKEDGSLEYFEISDESDGTQRLLDLFTILYSQEEHIFVIDELERSMHPHLVRKILQWFLMYNPKGQLIFTTHESTLLDQKLLRRDSYWFTEKSKAGASFLYSLESFKVRHDLNYAKGYLSGRFGAIPIFGHSLLSPRDPDNHRGEYAEQS